MESQNSLHFRVSNRPRRHRGSRTHLSSRPSQGGARCQYYEDFLGWVFEQDPYAPRPRQEKRIFDGYGVVK